MPTKKAIATGLWSATATWDGGTVPLSTEDVYANNFTVTIDQDVTCILLSTTSGTGITAGGGFILNATRTINANLFGGVNIVTFSAASPSSATINGNVQSTGNGYGIIFSGTGTLNVNGNLTQVGGDAKSINITSTGTLNHVGNITMSGNGAWGINTSTACTINTTGTLTQNSTSANTYCIIAGALATVNHVGNVVSNAGQATSYVIHGGISVTVTGNVTGSNIILSHAIFNSTTSAVLTVIGTQTAGSVGYTVYMQGTTQYTFFTGPFICHSLGQMPILVQRMFMIPTPTTYFQFRDNSTAGSLVTPAPTYTLYPAAAAIDAPAEADVRDGVVYANTTQTGTLAVPPDASVALGVPVDASVGSAVLSALDIANAVGEVLGAKIASVLP
jgi:hypothetical protein